MLKQSTRPIWMRHRAGVSFSKGKWRCHHGSYAKNCAECTWESGYLHGMWVAKRQWEKDRSVLVNIRMEITDAKKHYSKTMHKRMLLLVDALLQDSPI